jgi:hypothetical protein
MKADGQLHRLRLRKVTGHPQAPNAWRVIYTRDDGAEWEIGSIGHQLGAHGRQYWSWGIDTPALLGRLPFRIDGEALDRDDAMKQFKAVWDVFAGDADRLERFLARLARRDLR